MFALHAYNMMRGIEWAAIPVIVELLGIEDVDMFVTELCAIRDWRATQDEAK